MRKRFCSNKTVTLENVFPTMYCPVCGKEFLLQRDWGCVVTEKGTGDGSIRVCSIPCMKKLESMFLERNAKRARNTRTVRAYKMVLIDKMSKDEVMKELNVQSIGALGHLVDHAITMYWKEIQWLEEHDAWLPSLSPAATSLPEGETRSAT